MKRFPPLYAILDEEMSARAGWSIPSLAQAYLSGGARLLQVRAKLAPGRALLAMCEEVLAEARRAGAILIVNDRADIAAAAGADGVHLGQDDLPASAVARAFPSLGLIGVSTHSPEQVDQAASGPAGYISVGPVFETRTKTTADRSVGVELVGYAVGRAGLSPDQRSAARPVVAIGGITLERAPEVFQAGATSVAVISDLLSTGDPEGRVRQYVARLGR
jgi:thiamine-phosphate pyrophosphorylase